MRSAHEPIRIRVHHLLTSGDGTLALKWSSTNVYTEDAAGNPRYDWTRLDAIMDELTRPGIEPFVQASFMPQALSSQPEPYTPNTREVRTAARHGVRRRVLSTEGLPEVGGADRSLGATQRRTLRRRARIFLAVGTVE